MGLWKLTFLNYGTLKEGHTFLFSTCQIFCQKLLYHIIAMLALKRFRIVTHCYTASFSIKTLFCKTNNIFYSQKTEYQTKPNNDSENTSKIKVRSCWKFSKFCLPQQLFAFKKFCMEMRLCYISKITNVKKKKSDIFNFLSVKYFIKPFLLLKISNVRVNYCGNYGPLNLLFCVTGYNFEKLNNRQRKTAANSLVQNIESQCQNVCLVEVSRLLTECP